LTATAHRRQDPAQNDSRQSLVQRASPHLLLLLLMMMTMTVMMVMMVAVDDCVETERRAFG